MLENWNDIADDFDRGDLLLGNGFSINIHQQFSYSSLKEKADFSRITERLFTLPNGGTTSNFESVLFNISICLRYLNILKGSLQSQTKFSRAYSLIRAKLFEALISVHISKEDFLIIATTLDNWRNYLVRCNKIFTTNYDLILPWIILSESAGEGFKDYFFSGSVFDIDNVESCGGETLVHYLHGAIFLCSDNSKNTYKLNGVAGINNSIMSIKSKILREDKYPLIITEGYSKQKLASINRHDYLKFCYDTFNSSVQKITIFGHSLDTVFDGHIIDSLNKEQKAIAVGIYTNNGMLPDHVVETKKDEFRNKLPRANLTFFDSATHPLGKL